MSPRFRIGDHVRWNSEAGYVTGRVVRIITEDTEFKGRMRRASPEAPQYELKSDKTDHHAMHHEWVLEPVRH